MSRLHEARSGTTLKPSPPSIAVTVTFGPNANGPGGSAGKGAATIAAVKDRASLGIELPAPELRRVRGHAEPVEVYRLV